MNIYLLRRQEALEGWHFLANDRRLSNSPQRPQVLPGEVLHVAQPIIPHLRGLHGCTRLTDALAYAPGSVVCRTQHWGITAVHGNELCSEFRSAIFMFDGSRMLQEFSVIVATAALDSVENAGYTVDPRSRLAVQAKREWLAGNADNESLREARSNAFSAADALYPDNFHAGHAAYAAAYASYAAENAAAHAYHAYTHAFHATGGCDALESIIVRLALESSHGHS